jgi:RNA polymerase sigma-70 factor (ECF subfamily)
MIEEFLDSLTKENRVIFLRRYWFSDPYKVIAEQVGLSEKIVSVRLTRIRHKLREFLKDREVSI